MHNNQLVKFGRAKLNDTLMRVVLRHGWWKVKKKSLIGLTTTTATATTTTTRVRYKQYTELYTQCIYGIEAVTGHWAHSPTPSYAFQFLLNYDY